MSHRCRFLHRLIVRCLVTGAFLLIASPAFSETTELGEAAGGQPGEHHEEAETSQTPPQEVSEKSSKTDGSNVTQDPLAPWPDVEGAGRGETSHVKPPVGAAAEPVPPQQAEPPLLDESAFSSASVAAPRSESYRGMLLIYDSVTTAMMLLGVAMEEYDVVFPVGAGVGANNGLFAHAQHRRVGVGFLTVVLRGGMGIGACALAPDCFEQEFSPGAALALVGGISAAAALDIIFLAEKPIKRRNYGFNLGVGPTAGGVTLAIGGAL